MCKHRSFNGENSIRFFYKREMAVRQAVKLDVSFLSWLLNDAVSNETIQRRMLGLLTNDESGRKRQWPSRKLSRNLHGDWGKPQKSQPEEPMPEHLPHASLRVSRTADFQEMWILFISCVYGLE
jgi:hypothetical protein